MDKMRSEAERLADEIDEVYEQHALCRIGEETLRQGVVAAIRKALDAARQPQERGEAVAWVRCHPDGTLTTEFLADAAIEPVRRNSKAWVPLYTHPTPDAGRVAELEARIAEIASKHCPDYPGIDDCGPMERLYAIEATLTGRLDACGDLHARIAALESQLAESREREGRMRGLLEDMRYELHQYTEGFDVIWGRVEAALAAEKEGE